MTFRVIAYQDKVETESVFMVDGADLGKGQKDVKLGGEINGAQDTVGIDYINKPLELEIEETFSLKKYNIYSVVLDLSDIE